MRKILTVFLAVCMVCLSVVVASAQEGNVAKIGNTEYATLQEAVDNAQNGDEIVLISDIELSEKVIVAADDKITLDLAGFTVSYNPTVSGTTRVIENNGELTVKDSVSGGKITSSAANPDTANIPGYASNTVVNGGKFTLESGTIENTTASGSACYAIDTAWYGENATVAPTVTINGGAVVAVKPAIRMIGYAENVTNTLIVNGGEIKGTRAFWIHLPGSDNTVSPSVVVDINGGTFTATSDPLAVYSYSYGNSYDKVLIDISDGTFKGEFAVGGGSSNGGLGTEKVTVSGGTFEDLYSYMADERADIAISGGVYEVEVYASYLANGYYSYEMQSGGFSVRQHNDVEFVAAKDPSCKEEGNKAYYACKDANCGKYFEDEACTEELSNVVIAKEAHAFKDGACQVCGEKDASYILPEKNNDGKLEVKEEDMESAIQSAVGTEEKTVVIKTEEAVSVELPAAAITSATQNNVGVTIKNDEITTTFDEKTLETISQANTNNETVILSVEPIKTEELNNAQKKVAEDLAAQIVIKAEALVGDKKVSDFKGGKVKVEITVEIAENEDLSDYTVAYIDDKGEITKCETAVSADGKSLIVTLTHFSEYVVAKTDVVDKVMNTGDKSFVPIFAVMFVLLVVAAVVWKKKSSVA